MVLCLDSKGIEMELGCIRLQVNASWVCQDIELRFIATLETALYNFP